MLCLGVRAKRNLLVRVQITLPYVPNYVPGLGFRASG